MLSAPSRICSAFLLTGCWLVASVTSFAQSKATFPWGLYFGGQANYLTAHQHAALFRFRLLRNFDSDYNALAGNQLQRAQIQLGYEWLLTQRWSGGIAEKAVFDPYGFRTFHSAAFLRHTGHIGSVQFRKRALFEHLARNQQQPGSAQIRIRADLDRTFTIGRFALRPRLAYEIQFDLSFEKKTEIERQEDRTVDHGYLRVELAVDLSERLSVVPYYLKRTDFIFAAEQYDANGNILVPKGPRNLIFPTVGLDVRYTFSGKAAGATRALTTFEGFQD